MLHLRSVYVYNVELYLLTTKTDEAIAKNNDVVKLFQAIELRH
jgi:hypothetical protein